MRPFILLLLILSGCQDRVIPGDGTLAIIDVDDGFWANDLLVPDKYEQVAADADGTGPITSEMAAVRAGVHYWNKLGANIKLADEVTEDNHAPHFSLRRGGTGIDDSTTIGTEWPTLGYAIIYVDTMKNLNLFDYRFMRANVAHEIGHALGMVHISSETGAIMTPVLSWIYNDPSDDDQNQFCKLFPNCTRVNGWQ